MMNRKEYLTIEGLRKIVAIKASLNLGLSEELKSAFPNVVPIPRPLIQNKKILDPYWLAGFASGEACFLINIYKSSPSKLGEAVKLIFNIAQHSRDSELLISFEKYLGCGLTNKHSGDATVFIVTRLYDITEKIIPFFDKYPIIGVKSQDYQDFKKVAKLTTNEDHLTTEGLDNIRKIKAGMNKGRVKFREFIYLHDKIYRLVITQKKRVILFYSKKLLI